MAMGTRTFGWVRLAGTTLRVAALLGCAGVLTACNPNRISGSVESVYGEALPGVAVKIQQQTTYAVTNGLGSYSLNYTPGNLVLEYIKSGYAPAELELPVDGYRPVPAATVRMWRLPSINGVFIYEENKYREATMTQADALPVKDNVLYGTRRDVERHTDNPEPFLVLHRMPPEGVAMQRMERRTITLIQEGAQATEIEAYVAAEPIPVGAEPLDYPARLLHRLTLPGSLLPGVYAVHWGALEGHPDDEGRMSMYMFEVFDPETGPAPMLTPDGDTPEETAPKAADDESGPLQG